MTGPAIGGAQSAATAATRAAILAFSLTTRVFGAAEPGLTGTAGTQPTAAAMAVAMSSRASAATAGAAAAACAAV